MPKLTFAPARLVAVCAALVPVSWAALCLAPPEAPALSVKRTAKDRISISGTGCDARVAITAKLPRGARRPIKVHEPRVGDPVWDSQLDERVAVIEAVQVREGAVRIIAWADLGSYPCANPGHYGGQPWVSRKLTLRVSYRLPVRLGLRLGKTLADVILDQKFGNSYRYGNGKRLRCKHKGQVRIGCRVSWWLGDSSYKGKIQVWLTKNRRERVRPRYRLRVKAFDDYCIAQGRPRKSCVSIVKASR